MGQFGRISTRNRRAYAVWGIFLLVMGLSLACGGAAAPEGEGGTDLEATIAAGVSATQMADEAMQATIDAAVAATAAQNQSELAPPANAGQAESAPPTEPTAIPPTPSFADVEAETLADAAVTAESEVELVLFDLINGLQTQDMPLIKAIHHPMAMAVDVKGTPDDETDDEVWYTWEEVNQLYLNRFSNVSTLAFAYPEIEVQEGVWAVVSYSGVVLDGEYFETPGYYYLQKENDAWLIVREEFGFVDFGVSAPPTQPNLYSLALGQHTYQQPWGGDRGDPCRAWETGNFDDTQPYFRGFTVELLLTNNSNSKVPDDWGRNVYFYTAQGNPVRACYFTYEGSGPPAGATSSVTFFAVIPQGDYVNYLSFSLGGQTINLCLDGGGGWYQC